jgi:predicted Fe-S protein YdhL (DUF1289 family)
MAKFPTIDSPCPLTLAAMPRAGADFCGGCRRQVHDLRGMDDAARRQFMSSCGDRKVCVAYTLAVPRSRAAALGLGVGLAAALVAVPAIAADPLVATTPAAQSPLPGDAVSSSCPADPTGVTTMCATDAEELEADELLDIIVVGGVDRAGDATWQDEDSVLAELPRGDARVFLDEDAGVRFEPAPDAPR